MTAVRIWLGLDLRRRWRSLVVLALLVALSSGAVTAALAGARRGATAVQRLQAQTLPGTVVLLANTPGFDWAPVRALPGVEALTTFAVDYVISAEGRPGDLLLPPATLGFPNGDDAAMRTIEKPVVHSGRLPDPTRADEVVVSRQFVIHHHLGVGDSVTLHLPTPAELIASTPPATLTGPVVRARIVGVVSSPWFSDQPGGTGFVQPSPGLAARYPLNVLGDLPGTSAAHHNPRNQNFQNAMVRLRGGEAAIPAFQRQFEALTGRADIDVWNRPQQMRDIERFTTSEAQFLAAFAAAVFAAALFLIGQAIVRYTAASLGELQTLRAIGMTPRQAVLAATAGPALFGAAGALLGAAAAVAASPLFPLGTGGLMEPEPGLDVDGPVLASVALGVLLLVGLGAATSAWLALSAERRARAPRRSAVARLVSRAGLGVPVLVGTRFALEPGTGRTAVPVRPALIGAVIGVLGVVAAFTLAHGVADAGQNPERYGQTFQLMTMTGFNDQNTAPQPATSAAIAAYSDVTAVGDVRTAVATGPGRRGSVTLFADQPGPKPLPVVITSGRMAQAANEVVLAPHSLAALDTAVGRRVELTGSRGTAAFTVTGVGLTPIGPHNNYSDGGWVTAAGYDAIFTGFKFRMQLIAVRPGADLGRVATGLAAAVVAAVPQDAGASFERAEPPTELYAIRQIQSLPVALAAFLGLLAAGAIGHALSTAVRRRRHDVAVLQAVGMTRWQSRGIVVTQASVLAAVGLVFGVPLGLAAGRTLWRVVADYTPLQYVAPLALWALLLVGPLALLLANLLAAWPAHQAARLRIGHVLRAE